MLKILDRPKTNIYRVGSLYGTHKPAQNFPTKLLKSFPTPCSLALPENDVSPTPTDWLSEKLLNHSPDDLSKTQIYNVFPEGSVAITDWAKIVLGPKYEVFTSGYDENRPTDLGTFEFNLSESGLNMKTDNWEDLWKARNETKGDK